MHFIPMLISNFYVLISNVTFLVTSGRSRRFLSDHFQMNYFLKSFFLNFSKFF